MTAFSPVPTQTLTRVAILIDGDHIPATLRPVIMQEAARMGHVVSTQLFCDLSMRADWAVETDLDAQHCKGRPGKNNTDISLCIAALDLAYRGLAGSFLIVSNDRDFEPLLRHLKRMGCDALQMKQSALLPPAIASPVSPQLTAAAPPTLGPKTQMLLSLVRAAIEENGTSRGLPIYKLDHLLSASGFRISSTPQKTWRAWLLAHPQHFSCDPKGPTARVRITY